jgi:hypothetical protein
MLPSSNPLIFKSIKFKDGELKVIPDYSFDTHFLCYNNKRLAFHPNGYSCHSLAERLVLGDENKIKEQADYIVRCGGGVDYVLLESLINL